MEKAIALIGSFLGLLAFLRSVLPAEIWSMLEALAARTFSWAVVYNQIKIHELVGCEPNELYCDAELYVSTLVRLKPGGKRRRPGLPARRMLATRLKYAARATYMLDVGEAIVDSFRGADFWWVYYSEDRRENIYIRDDDVSHEYDAKRHYTVAVRQRHGDLLDEYLEYVQARAKEARQEFKVRLLYTNAGRGTRLKCIPLEHPATFDSLAMDAELKSRLMADLKTFMGAREFYRRAGRAWKRGYLLHGPPGTGKSSLIAAMANFTGYDIYDLELTQVNNNASLRKLLMAISNKSIIVIEDIDCSVQMWSRDQDQGSSSDNEEEEEFGPYPNGSKPGKNKMTLSGLLNFTDGLWSCCGNERIIVFTTNFIDKIDPALLRTGRMDMHICMSYCTIDGIRVLARTYLGLDEEDDQIAEAMAKIEGLVSGAGAQMTPADVAEVFTQHREVADASNVLLILCSELEKRLPSSREPVAESTV